jgi:hypothetical protein
MEIVSGHSALGSYERERGQRSKNCPYVSQPPALRTSLATAKVNTIAPVCLKKDNCKRSDGTRKEFQGELSTRSHASLDGLWGLVGLLNTAVVAYVFGIAGTHQHRLAMKTRRHPNKGAHWALPAHVEVLLPCDQTSPSATRTSYRNGEIYAPFVHRTQRQWSQRYPRGLRPVGRATPFL